MDFQITTKDAILKVTLEIIGEKGTYATSIREIAARAEVNSAAISYYFGSKDKLIQEASNLFYKEVEGIFKLLINHDRSAEERIRCFAGELIKYIDRYPGFFKNEIAQHLLKVSVNKDVEDRVKFQVETITEALSEMLVNQDKEILLIKGVQFLSSLIYPQLWSKDSLESIFQHKNYSELIEVYIDQLIRGIYS